MAVPWMQIVHLVPSIVEVSRELLKRSKTPVATPNPDAPGDAAALAARIAALEENERRQAELVSTMADQLAALAKAVSVLHRRLLWASAGAGAALALGVIAIALLLRT
jgi:hypothetical protein